jgi:predicted Zn-dependent protease
MVNQATSIAADVAAGAGVITPDQAESTKRVGSAVTKTFQDITPEQEYYIGRTVAATVLAGYKPKDSDDLNGYVNRVGQSLAQFSTKPETFGGYHFLVLDSDEINAFAAPGGLVLVTRGLLRCCRRRTSWRRCWRTRSATSRTCTACGRSRRAAEFGADDPRVGSAKNLAASIWPR